MKKSQFITTQLQKYPNAAKDVLEFIADFIGEGANRVSDDILISKFTNGYCYYFALMLADAFGGRLMWARELNHIVWQDTRKNCHQYTYDISGVFTTYARLTPFEELMEDREGFRHRGKDHDIFYDIEEYCKSNSLERANVLEQVFSIVPLEDRTYENVNETDVYRYWSIWKNKRQKEETT